MPISPDPFETLTYAAFRGAARGFVDGLAQNGPKLFENFVLAWRAAMKDTLEDSKVDQSELDALKREQADAIASGELPPANVR